MQLCYDRGEFHNWRHFLDHVFELDDQEMLARIFGQNAEGEGSWNIFWNHGVQGFGGFVFSNGLCLTFDRGIDLKLSQPT